MTSRLNSYIDEQDELDSVLLVKRWQKKVAAYLHSVGADDIARKFEGCMNAEYMNEMYEDEIDHWDILSEQIGLLSGYVDKQATQKSANTLQPDSVKGSTLSKRSKTTYLNIIGALLEVSTGTFKDETFSSETQLRDFLSDKFKGFRGVTGRTLAEKFAAAKKSIGDE